MRIVDKDFSKRIGNEMEFGLVNELIKNYIMRESDKYINKTIKSKLQRIDDGKVF